MRIPRTLRYLVCAVAAVALIALVAGLAEAQSTGGSMGGGSFGGGGSSGGSYSSGGGGSYSSGGGYSSSGGGGGGALTGCGAAGVLFFVLVFIGVILLLARTKTRGMTSAIDELMDVTAIRLGIDWRARKYLQKQLDRIATTADTSTPAGLMKMLRETTILLRRVSSSWVYAAIENRSPMHPSEAESEFQTEVQRARTGYQHELVRAADGHVTTAASPDVAPRPEEGEGFVVVTLVVAARHDLLDVHDPRDADDMRRAIEAIGALTPGTLVACEIVWSPADPKDRMSSAELVVVYPGMHKIDGSTIAGRVYCAYCGGPYPAELLSCPHCGARNEDDDEAA